MRRIALRLIPERIARDHILPLLLRPDEELRLELEPLRCLRLQPTLHVVARPLPAGEYDIAALQQRLRLVAPRCLQKLPQHTHRDQAIAPDVDPAQQRNVCRHPALQSPLSCLHVRFSLSRTSSPRNTIRSNPIRSRKENEGRATGSATVARTRERL